MKSKLQASAASGRYLSDGNVRLRDEVMTADTADKVHHVLAQLHLLPAIALRDELMYGQLETITALQKWPAMLRTGSRLLYVGLLRRLKLTAAELRQTELLSTLTSLATSTFVADEEREISSLLQLWQMLLLRSERYKLAPLHG